MEKTAVEWLYDNLNKCFDKFDNGEYAYTDFINASKEVREQAKEMEKEQIIGAYFECWKVNMPDGFECKLSAKEYYNQTFKQD